jgi:hypothetical protein
MRKITTLDAPRGPSVARSFCHVEQQRLSTTGGSDDHYNGRAKSDFAHHLGESQLDRAADWRRSSAPERIMRHF